MAAKTGRLYAFDDRGKTIRERQVPVWFIRDAGDEENDNGIYIALSSTADLEDQVSDVGLGITITEETLLELGYVYLPGTATFISRYPDAAVDEPTPEEVEPPLEYVKVF